MNDDLFRATTKKYMELRHINTLAKLEAHTTISHATFCKYMKDPEEMRLKHFEQIMSALNVPIEEQIKILK